MSKLSKSELVELSVTIYGALVEGLSDDEIMDKFRLSADTFAEAKKNMYETRSEALRSQPREHTYIDYVVEQRRNVRDLNNLIKNLDEKTQYNALVGAIRLRSDIVDKIVEKGHDFGVIKKTPARTEVIAGLIVADMTTDDLRTGILSQTKLLKDITDKYGDGDMLSLPVGKTHYAGTPIVVNATGSVVGDDDEDDEDAVVARVATRTARAKTSKRSAGRKRVRD